MSRLCSSARKRHLITATKILMHVVNCVVVVFGGGGGGGCHQAGDVSEKAHPLFVVAARIPIHWMRPLEKTFHE